jgi:hypothetical protein
MTSKEMALKSQKELDAHFWDVVGAGTSATMTAKEAADALQVTEDAVRNGLEDGRLDSIGFMHKGSRKQSRFCVILRSKFIRWYTGR